MLNSAVRPTMGRLPAASQARDIRHRSVLAGFFDEDLDGRGPRSDAAPRVLAAALFRTTVQRGLWVVVPGAADSGRRADDDDRVLARNADRLPLKWAGWC